jgi:hypothetical protein
MSSGDRNTSLNRPASRSLVPACWLAGLLALGLGLRIAVVATHSSELSTDRDAYLGIAQGIWEGRGYSTPGSRQPTAYRPPLYPLLLAPISAADQAWLRGAVQVLLGTATVALTWIAARRSNFDLRASVIAAGLVAVDPLLLVYTPQVMTETLAVFLTAAVLAGLAGRSPADEARPETGPPAGRSESASCWGWRVCAGRHSSPGRPSWQCGSLLEGSLSEVTRGGLGFASSPGWS